MIQQQSAPSGRILVRRLLALPVSAAIGGLLMVLVFAGLRPGPAAAAGTAEPATVYPCTPLGFNTAVAAGGSATFNCGSPTTITVTDRQNVPHDLSLDGNNNLILSGGTISGVFTVPTGIHLSLLNLTLRDATGYSGGAIYNAGWLAVTNAHFISDSAILGAALYNAAGASAMLSGTVVENSSSFGGSLWNGDSTVSPTASLAVVNSFFTNNTSLEGAAIGNANGPLTVTGSSFSLNTAVIGGAIYNNSTLQVENSAFEFNRAGFLVAELAGRPRPSLPSRATSGISDGGGALYVTTVGNTVIAGSAFTGNISLQGGGAIMFGDLPSGPITPTGASLTVAGSTFVDNCTGGPGGALSTLLPASISDSSFTNNSAESSASPCFIISAARPFARPALQAPALANMPAVTVPTYLAGAGGAVMSAYNLAVTNTSFLSNTATITYTGGGGAIDSLFGARLSVSEGTFQGNYANQDGGAIANGGQASLVNSSFTRNTAQNDSGGGVFNLGLLSVFGSNFTGNYGAPGQGLWGKGGGAIVSTLPLAVSGPSSRRGAAGNGGAQGRPAGPGLFFSYGLTVDHSTFVSNSSEFEGGAIDAGSATIVASTFTSNTAAYGGAIDILAPGFTISASTFNANAAVTTTLYSPQEGGAVDMGSNGLTDINVINSTFYANVVPAGAVGGAIDGDGETIGITNSTFVSNTAADSGSGGAFARNGNFILFNTLVAFNSGGNCQVTMTLSSANLEFPGTTCGGASVQADPKILPPANNGGPTLTSALRAGSPAIDTGDNAGCPSTDQRGAHRLVDAHCDIGAFEFGGQVPWWWLPVIRR